MKQKALSVFTLTMINVATIGSLKNWPTNAEFGFSSVFFFLLATIIFFIPTALVSAELATGWPQMGGIYVWVKEAFGHRMGFLAAWLLWFQNVVWYPTALSFIAGTIAYLIDPALIHNPLYAFCFVVGLFWLSTLVNLRGMHISGWISSLGMILGTFLPGLFIIALGTLWITSGRPSEISFTLESFIPRMNNLNELVLFSGVLIGLAGIEMSAVHAADVANPRKSYPRAILYSLLIILALSIPGILAIATVVPQKEISLVAGSIQALQIFLKAYNLQSLMPLLSLLIAIGTTASVSTWIAGPTRGLLAAAKQGDLPPLFHRVNKKNMPISLLIAQAIIVSLLSLAFILMPSLNAAYWLLMAIVAELYLLMYLLLFAAALKLRYKHPHTPRAYKVPGGKTGLWIICTIGFLSTLGTIFVGLFPPTQLPIENEILYFVLITGGVALFTIAPSLILLFQKPTWKALR